MLHAECTFTAQCGLLLRMEAKDMKNGGYDEGKDCVRKDKSSIEQEMGAKAII